VSLAGENFPSFIFAFFSFPFLSSSSSFFLFLWREKREDGEKCETGGEKGTRTGVYDVSNVSLLIPQDRNDAREGSVGRGSGSGSGTVN
jgi:hypothetical protein